MLPSLNQILNAYIPYHIPKKHEDKKIVICLCLGGDIQQNIRLEVKGYTESHETANITFEEWNGDKLAGFILSSFLQPEIMPESSKSQLRKSLAMLDEPEVSYKYFRTLVSSLSKIDSNKCLDYLTALRQINICLWILFAWAREEGNVESAYLSGEFALLHAWNIAKDYFSKKDKNAKAIKQTFDSIFFVYQNICSEYSSKILPHINKRNAISFAIKPSNKLDVNLKLFDLLGRLAIEGIWCYRGFKIYGDQNKAISQKCINEFRVHSEGVKGLISNNPSLFLPFKDDQAIDISIALLLLSLDENNHNDMKVWLSEMLHRAIFSYTAHNCYPCNLDSYSDLLEHPQLRNDEYRQEVTRGSILYPIIALWAAILGDNELYNTVKKFKEKHLAHCDFQLWFPDETSEEHFYTNSDLHGAVLLPICVERTAEELLEQVFGECEKSTHFRELSAVKYCSWPLILIACRHYRLPLTPHLMEGVHNSFKESNDIK